MVVIIASPFGGLYLRGRKIAVMSAKGKGKGQPTPCVQEHEGPNEFSEPLLTRPHTTPGGHLLPLRPSLFPWSPTRSRDMSFEASQSLAQFEFSCDPARRKHRTKYDKKRPSTVPSPWKNVISTLSQETLGISQSRWNTPNLTSFPPVIRIKHALREKMHPMQQEDISTPEALYKTLHKALIPWRTITNEKDIHSLHRWMKPVCGRPMESLCDCPMCVRGATRPVDTMKARHRVLHRRRSENWIGYKPLEPRSWQK